MEIIDTVVYWSGLVTWGPHMLIFFFAAGIYFTIRLRGIQIKNFIDSLKAIGEGKRYKGTEKGDITPFQAFATSLSGTVGTANIAGVATAVALGGPGAIFWMWLSGFLGMVTKFTEVVLGVKYRRKSPDGSMIGGPMYYISEGLLWKRTAALFALGAGIKTAFSTPMIQSNSISVAFKYQFGIPMPVSSLIIAFTVWLVIIGGIKTIGRVSEILAPFMSLLYILGGAIILVMFYASIPAVIVSIVRDAFTGRAAAGGFAGASFFAAIRYGVARGIYSNEAGVGVAPIAHAAAKTGSPVRQGLIAMMDVFIDTLVVSTITALVVLCTGEWLNGTTSSEMTANAFNTALPFGGGVIVTFSALLFGYSTLLAWSYYGEQCFVYLFGVEIKKLFKWTFCAVIFFGGFFKVETVWNFGDTLNGLMAIPNIIALILLTNVVIKATREYLFEIRSMRRY